MDIFSRYGETLGDFYVSGPGDLNRLLKLLKEGNLIGNVEELDDLFTVEEVKEAKDELLSEVVNDILDKIEGIKKLGWKTLIVKKEDYDRLSTNNWWKIIYTLREFGIDAQATEKDSIFLRL